MNKKVFEYFHFGAAKTFLANKYTRLSNNLCRILCCTEKYTVFETSSTHETIEWERLALKEMWRIFYITTRCKEREKNTTRKKEWRKIIGSTMGDALQCENAAGRHSKWSSHNNVNAYSAVHYIAEWDDVMLQRFRNGDEFNDLSSRFTCFFANT